MNAPAYASPHSSEWHRAIAERNTILRAQIGSGLHGLSIPGTNDRDEMGVCIEPADCVIGLKAFEQYQYRTQPDGARSGAGDTDLVIYSLRKWARLAAQGNPTVLLLLFVPPWEIVEQRSPGIALQDNAALFLSRDCGRRFLGYLDAQRDQMLGLRSQHTNRPELIATHGFDTKFAYHAVRLGVQGVELLADGRITLPMPEPTRSWLLDVRTGKVDKQTVLDTIGELRDQLARLTESVALPDSPDGDKIDAWLVDTYQHWWAARHD